MADLVRLVFIHENDLISFCNGLCTASVMEIHSAIRKHHVRGHSALHVGLMPTRTPTHNIPHRYRLARHQRTRIDVRHLQMPHSITTLSIRSREQRCPVPACSRAAMPAPAEARSPGRRIYAFTAE